MSTPVPSWERTGENVPLSYWIKQRLPKYQPTALVLWGVTAATAAVFLVQPFDWIDKTFIHVPPPEIKEDA